MGIISVKVTDKLYWLGRYSERVYTTIRLFADSYDTMIDSVIDDYVEFCRRLDIPDCYKDSADFVRRYCFSSEDPNSIYSNLMRAFDNAVTLRSVLGSDVLAYVQLAVYSLNKASASQAPLVELQEICDNILAFWGNADDSIEDDNARNIIKVGKRVERIDLYGRLAAPRKALLREIHRLQGRIVKTQLRYNPEDLVLLEAMALGQEIKYHELVEHVNQLTEG